jgi:RNA polymerase sigma factor (sigma-70 family)
MTDRIRGEVPVHGGDGDLPGISAMLRRLVAVGLGSAMGLSADWRTRSSIDRVARLGREELARRLEVIYRKHYKTLVRYARDTLGNQQDAEDVVSEAFLRIWRADPDLKLPEALGGYLRSAVRNEALDRGTHKSRDRAAHEPRDVLDLDAYLASPDKPVDERVCDEITLTVALQVLSARQRQCVVLRFLQGLTVQDTAALLGISEGNVKRICHEACSRMAAAFDLAA